LDGWRLIKDSIRTITIKWISEDPETKVTFTAFAGYCKLSLVFLGQSLHTDPVFGNWAAQFGPNFQLEPCQTLVDPFRSS